MQFVKYGQPFSFDYSAYDQASGLFVAAKIYNVTTGTPVFDSQVVMSELLDGVYEGQFTGLYGQSYLVISAVYLDGTYTTLDTSRAPAAECYQDIELDSKFLLFNYGSYDQDETLYIAGNVFEDGSFLSQEAMDHVFAGVYFAAFTGSLDKTYSVVKTVYTDAGFTTPDPNRAPSGETFQSYLFSSITVVKNVLAGAVLVGQELEAVLEARTC